MNIIKNYQLKQQKLWLKRIAKENPDWIIKIKPTQLFEGSMISSISNLINSKKDQIEAFSFAVKYL